ncbi:MAG: hypothetical protein HIU57_05445 [Acidobacteria bacterium]|nr:hypothetical protein [Acidobacteriota bacterium]
MACTGLTALDPICLVAKSIGHLGASVTNSVFSSVATAFGNTADSAINWLWSQMTSATAISFGGASFGLDLGIVSAIAAVVCVGLFLVQLATSALKRDGSGIGRALRGLVVATLGCAIALASLDLVLAAVDQLCTGVVSMATGDSISTLGAKIIDPAMFTGLVAGPGTILILSLIAIVAVAVVWFALVVRKMLIIITAIFAPLAFAGGVADLSRGWVRKWLEAMLALVFSKLILILIFVIGLGVLGGMGSPTNAVGLSRITGDITGLLILLVAGLSPWMALKLVHFTGEHMATLAGSATHATSGASRIVSAPQKVASMRSTAQNFATTPPHATSRGGVGTSVGAGKSLGAGALVGVTNGDALKDVAESPSATSSGVTTVKAAGSGVASGGAVGAEAVVAAATMHAARSSVSRTASSSAGVTTPSVAQNVTPGTGVTEPRITPRSSPVNSPSSDESSSGSRNAADPRATRGRQPSPGDTTSPAPSPLASPAPVHSTSPAAAPQPVMPIAHRAAGNGNAVVSSPVRAPADHAATPTTSLESSVPPLRFSAWPRPPEESS